MSALGDFIKERLTELGMNQSQLAHKMGVGTGQVSMWISGTTPRKNLEGLADALECTEGELIEIMGSAPKPGPKKGGGGRKRSADWQFDIRENYDLTLPEEKHSNGNGSKPSPIADITPPITSNGQGGIVRRKIAILQNAAEVRGMLAVARLVGDERTIEVTKMVEEKMVNIEAEARGLDE